MYLEWSENRLARVVALLLSMGLMDVTAYGQQVKARTTATPVRPQPDHPLDSALQMSRESLDHIEQNIHDYTALFIKRNRVDGRLGELHCAKLKLRHRKHRDGELHVPMSVYLDFLRPNSVKGREVLWVENQNEGKLIAHESGFRNLMNVKLEPTSYLAMRNQRYPITEIGIENLTRKLIDTATRDRKYGECEVKLYRNAKVGGHVCDMVEVIHPVPREHFDFYRARVFFSQELNIPIRYASWSWPVEPGGGPVLEEEYTYMNVQVNVGLGDADFDTANPDYRFW